MYKKLRKVRSGQGRVVVLDGQIIGEQENLYLSEPVSLQEVELFASTRPNT